MNTTSTIDRIAGAPILVGSMRGPRVGLRTGPRPRARRDARSWLAHHGPWPDRVPRRATGGCSCPPRPYDMSLVGGFLPVSLHIDPALDLAEATAAIATLAATGAEVVVLAARSANGSYDRKVALSDEEWTILVGNLGRLQDIIAAHGWLRPCTSTSGPPSRTGTPCCGYWTPATSSCAWILGTCSSAGCNHLNYWPRPPTGSRTCT